jgi:hypothetical protein
MHGGTDSRRHAQGHVHRGEIGGRPLAAPLVGHAGTGVNFVARDPYTGRLWALLGHGHWGAKLSISDDEGATWADAPSQIKYPEGARTSRRTCTRTPRANTAWAGASRRRPATLAKLWIIGFGPGGSVYVGTIPGGLFESRDGGASFELNRPLWNHESRGGDLFAGEGTGETKWFGTPGLRGRGFRAGHPLHRRRPARPAARAGGRLHGRRHRDARRRADLAQPQQGHDPRPHARARGRVGPRHALHRAVPRGPDHVWQQNHVGVYYSSDGAATWRKVSRPEQGSTSVPRHGDPTDGRTAWLVPGRSDQQRMTIDGGLFVARTEDGGDTWQALRNGLPQEAAPTTSSTGTRWPTPATCAFGSTTGNLYVSEDGGESAGRRWPQPAAHLLGALRLKAVRVESQRTRDRIGAIA